MDTELLYTNFRNQLDWIISRTPGESQTSVSQYLNMNDDYINHVRNNHNELSVRRLLRICEYLQTEPELFFQFTADDRDRLLSDINFDLRKLKDEELEALRNYLRVRTAQAEFRE